MKAERNGTKNSRAGDIVGACAAASFGDGNAGGSGAKRRIKHRCRARIEYQADENSIITRTQARNGGHQKRTLIVLRAYASGAPPYQRRGVR